MHKNLNLILSFTNLIFKIAIAFITSRSIVYLVAN